MSERLATGTSAPEHVRPATGTLLLLASTVITILAASSTPTPLYAVHWAEWGFDPITTTVVVGVYALSVLLALLVVGTLSDHVGREPVVHVALAGQVVVSMVVFATAAGVPELLAGRVVQGWPPARWSPPSSCSTCPHPPGRSSWAFWSCSPCRPWAWPGSPRP